MLKKPNRGNFSPGPCAKRPGWNVSDLQNALVGRSHRSKDGIAKINQLINLLREVLLIPDDYLVGIISGSATGSVECAMWNLLGPCGVDAICTDVFSQTWGSEIERQLKITDLRIFSSDGGDLPDLQACSTDRDIVFASGGTTSGITISNFDWISDSRSALVICDATSYVFSYDVPWHKLDAVAFSWQKGLGGEAGHGVLVLSPLSVQRITDFTPSWPIPRIYNLKKFGKLHQSIFEGHTINTPSLLIIEDFIGALNWSKSIGGISALMARVDKNYMAIKSWVNQSRFFEFLISDESIRSKNISCLKIKSTSLNAQDQWSVINNIALWLEENADIYDVAGHPNSFYPNIRIWHGPTVECSDLEAALPWLDLAFSKISR
ncbi:MAG: phosphoserine transaminase [Holosporales bacterium]|jgi:phosphoserine aminotransferase|nr:phosphoserine transaminase [Holosporales bacterium]